MSSVRIVAGYFLPKEKREETYNRSKICSGFDVDEKFPLEDINSLGCPLSSNRLRSGDDWHIRKFLPIWSISEEMHPYSSSLCQLFFIVFVLFSPSDLVREHVLVNSVPSRTQQITYSVKNNELNNLIIASNRIESNRFSGVHLSNLSSDYSLERERCQNGVIKWHSLAMEMDLSAMDVFFVVVLDGSILFFVFLCRTKWGWSFVILHIQLASEEDEGGEREQKYRYKHTEIMSISKDDERKSRTWLPVYMRN